MRIVQLKVDLTKYNPKFKKDAIGLTDMINQQLPQAPWGTFYNVVIEGAVIPVEKHGLEFLNEIITPEEEKATITFTYHKVTYVIRGGKLLVQSPLELQEICPFIIENYNIAPTEQNKIECAKMCIDMQNYLAKRK